LLTLYQKEVLFCNLRIVRFRVVATRRSLFEAGHGAQWFQPTPLIFYVLHLEDIIDFLLMLSWFWLIPPNFPFLSPLLLLLF
jgi:hypothetical protein